MLETSSWQRKLLDGWAPPVRPGLRPARCKNIPRSRSNLFSDQAFFFIQILIHIQHKKHTIYVLRLKRQFSTLWKHIWQVLRKITKLQNLAQGCKVLQLQKKIWRTWPSPLKRKRNCVCCQRKHIAKNPIRRFGQHSFPSVHSGSHNCTSRPKLWSSFTPTCVFLPYPLSVVKIRLIKGFWSWNSCCESLIQVFEAIHQNVGIVFF